jgi:hypothetical protein
MPNCAENSSMPKHTQTGGMPKCTEENAESLPHPVVPAARLDSAPDASPRSANDAPLPLARPPAPEPRPREIGGPPGPEPTRFGDWEKKGRCIDF